MTYCAHDAATDFNTSHMMSMAPLSRMGWPSRESEPRKKYPPALLRALGAVRLGGPYQSSNVKFKKDVLLSI